MRIVWVMLIGCPALFAQAGTGTLTGTVTDTTGAAINGARVTVVQPETTFSRNTVTNETGNYNLPGLRPAVYEISIEFPGFRRYHQIGFRIEVDQAARLDAQLQLGQLSEQIEVQGGAQWPHTENATL